MLGVYWNIDDEEKLKSIDNNKPIKFKQEKVMLPLAVSIATSGMNPKAFTKTIEDLKKRAELHNKSIDKPVTSNKGVNDMSKEEYLSLFG